jgi:parallel beta-helix repeat protein
MKRLIVIILFVLFTAINLIAATLYTPNGKSFNTFDAGRSSYDAAWFASYSQNNFGPGRPYPNSYVEGEWENGLWEYNCHVFAWNNWQGADRWNSSNDMWKLGKPSPYNLRWRNYPDVWYTDSDNPIGIVSYIETTTQSEASIVTYKSGSDITHSARIVGNGTRYISKWGRNPIVNHPPTEVPSIYGSRYKYYKINPAHRPVGTGDPAGRDWGTLENAYSGIPNDGAVSIYPGTHNVNSVITISSSTVDTYVKPGNVIINGSNAGLRFFPGSPALTIEDGVNLNVTGSKDHLFKFTSSAASPSRTDWGGFWVEDGGSINLNYCEIADATAGIQTAEIEEFSVKNSRIHHTNYHGILVDIPYGKTADILNNYIYNNVRAGILTVPRDGTVNIKNNVIYDNYDHGMFVQVYRGYIYNNTVTNNNDGIWVGGSSGPSIIYVKNNIVSSNNKSGYGSEHYGIWSGTSTGSEILTYNDVFNNSSGNYYGCSPGTGSISSDPQFSDPANDIYSLNSNSPCIDKGNPTSPINDDGTIADMGALYYPHGVINYPTTWNRDLNLEIDVTVSNGASLNIMPGNVIKFAAGKKLHVYGNLSANGSANNIIFTSLNTNPSNGDWYGILIDGSNASASINNCTIKYGDRGIRFYNSAAGTVSNSKISNNNYGVYLYKSKPTIQDCEINNCNTAGIYLSDNNYISGHADIINNSIHDHNNYGIFCYKSSPEIRENTIETNYKGVYCTNSSSPIFGAYNIRGNNLISNCYMGVSANYNSDPILGPLEPEEVGGWNQFIDMYYFIYAYNYSNVHAINNWWGSSPPDHNKFYAYYNSSTSNDISSSDYNSGYDENWSLKRKIDYARSLIYLDNPGESKKICSDIIDLNPDSSLSFLALNVYWAADRYQSEKEKTGQKDFQNLLINLSAKKYKCELYGYSELLLADFEGDKGLSRIDKVYNEYRDSFLPEAALYQKFLYFLDEKDDLSSALVVNEQLNEEYPESLFTEWSNEHLSNESSFNEKLSKSDISLKENGLPIEYNLFSNFPNPFNPSTRVKYALPKASNIQIAVYNSIGQKIKSFKQIQQPCGVHFIRWDGKNDAGLNVPSGLYILRFNAVSLEADNQSFTKSIKMLLLR